MGEIDIIYFPGVIYLLSDLLLALRILFNMCKEGGSIFIDTEGLNAEEPVCEFTGSLIHTSGNKEELSRTGWNWFIPTPSAMSRLIAESEFEEIKHSPFHGKRYYSYTKKITNKGVC